MCILGMNCLGVKVRARVRVRIRVRARVCRGRAWVRRIRARVTSSDIEQS